MKFEVSAFQENSMEQSKRCNRGLWTSTHRVVHPHLKGSLSRVTDCLRAGSIAQGLRGKLATRNKGGMIPLQDKHTQGCWKSCVISRLSHSFQIHITGKWIYKGTLLKYGTGKKPKQPHLNLLSFEIAYTQDQQTPWLYLQFQPPKTKPEF